MAEIASERLKRLSEAFEAEAAKPDADPRILEALIDDLDKLRAEVGLPAVNISAGNDVQKAASWGHAPDGTVPTEDPGLNECVNADSPLIGVAYRALAGALLAAATAYPHSGKRAEDVPLVATFADWKLPSEAGAVLSLFESLQRSHGFSATDASAALIAWGLNGRHQADGKPPLLGATMERSIRRLAAGVSPELAGAADESALGNSALLRVPAVVAYSFLWSDESSARTMAIRQGLLTHRHPISMACCSLFASAAWRFATAGAQRQALSLDDLLSQERHAAATGEFSGVLPSAIERLSKSISQGVALGSAKAMDTVWSAVQVVGTATSFVDAISRTIAMGGNMIGSAMLVGCLAGIRWPIPERLLSGESIGEFLDLAKVSRDVLAMAEPERIQRNARVTAKDLPKQKVPDEVAIAIARLSPVIEKFTELRTRYHRPFVTQISIALKPDVPAVAKAILSGLPAVRQQVRHVERSVDTLTILLADNEINAEMIRDVLVSGDSVIFASPLSYQLSQEVQGLIDESLTLDRLTPISLGDIIFRFSPKTQWESVSSEWVSHVTINELNLALREQPDKAVSRLRQLVERRLKTVATDSALDLTSLHGVEEAKRWAESLIVDMKDAREGVIDWSEVDHGALLVGPPGTGKTTLARAIAKRIGLNFIVVSPSEWSAAGRLSDHLMAIKASFSKAREMSPAIMFIDEIDTLGSRDGLVGQNKEYTTEVINCVLTELDGFSGRGRVVVLAATNNPDNVDPALKRAGRLDRVIPVPHPNAPDLAMILRHYLDEVDHELTEADCTAFGRAALGSTGADIERTVRDARRVARRDGKRRVQVGDIRRALFGLPGSPGVRHPIDESVLRRTCVHEAGHALVTLMTPETGGTVEYITVIGDGFGRGGFVVSSPSEEPFYTREQCRQHIQRALAGRAAEAVVFGEAQVSTGGGGLRATNDLAQATNLAKHYVLRYGFTVSGLLWHSPEAALTQSQQDEVSAVLTDEYEKAQVLIRLNRGKLDCLVEELMKKQEISGNELRTLVGIGKQ